MELLKIAMLFASLACLTFGKFLEPQERQYNRDRVEDTAETLQDSPRQSDEPRANNYFSRFLAVAADSPRYRNMCQAKTRRVRSSQLLGDLDQDIHPALVFETFCVSESDGEPKRCGSANYCVTQKGRQEVNTRPKGSDGRWRPKFITISVGCSCMSRT